MANEGSTKPLDGWFFGTAKQYVVAPDGTEYWPRTEMNKRIDELEAENLRVRGLLQRLIDGCWGGEKVLRCRFCQGKGEHFPGCLIEEVKGGLR